MLHTLHCYFVALLPNHVKLCACVPVHLLTCNQTKLLYARKVVITVRERENSAS